MRKSLKAFASLLVALMMLPVVAKAQQIPPVGVDPTVKIGTLPNGLTYYIRHNEYPKGQADFYIAQKVGSIVEDDSQRGLAHFLEHMCFNGTTHFPGKNLINWLESVGVKFGANLNAYTAVDQTVYNISNVPVAREGVQDSCLLILHDWANDLLLLPEEIDAERGVIHQEWRRSMVGQMRILEELLPKMYPGERYGYRLPIGTMDVVDNFAPQTLRDYYEKWYRPDLQGIIVVGDIDVNRIEGKIKEMFADIEMPANAAKREYFPVANTPGTIYAIGHDKEQQNSIAELMFKTEALPRELNNTLAYYIQDYITDMITMMLRQRLDEIASKPGAPFAQASSNYGNFFLANTKSSLDLFVAAKAPAELPSALAAAYRELLRACRGGFTTTEFERTKAEIISQYENAFNNRNTRKNGEYVNSYVNNFLDNKPIPTKEEEFQTIQQIAQMIPLQAVNQKLQQIVTNDNRVLLAMMPDTENGVYPTEQEFANALSSVDAETIEPYKEELKAEPLIEHLPAPGKIVSETHSDRWDATELTLSNGVKVVLKPTKFKENEIRFAAVALNGTSNYSDDYAKSLIFMPVALSEAGLGTYTKTDLDKYLAGKQVSVSPSLSNYTRALTGSSTPKDLPTLMELIYMTMTNVNITAEEYEALQGKYAALLHNQESNPQYVFGKEVMKVLYSSPRQQQLSTEVVNGAQRAQILEVVKDMTKNAADFTFVFVGNFDMDQMKTLLEQYIATLPANAATATKTLGALNPALNIKTGTSTDQSTFAMQTPQTWVLITSFGNLPYTMKNAQIASVAGQILSKRLLDKVREEMGAVYSIGAQGSMDRIGDQNVEIQSAFPMKPELKDETLQAIHDMIFDMAANNPSQEELDKVKEYMVKSYTENLENNGAWIGNITGFLRNGVDTLNGNVESMNSITTTDVKNFMNSLLSQGNYKVVVLDPEKK